MLAASWQHVTCEYWCSVLNVCRTEVRLVHACKFSEKAVQSETLCRSLSVQIYYDIISNKRRSYCSRTLSRCATARKMNWPIDLDLDKSLERMLWSRCIMRKIHRLRKLFLLYTCTNNFVAVSCWSKKLDSRIHQLKIIYLRFQSLDERKGCSRWEEGVQ